MHKNNRKKKKYRIQIAALSETCIKILSFTRNKKQSRENEQI